jgi:alkylhydroperoxidase/carboxymuconolactone decarboxylase family protein YurZ
MFTLLVYSRCEACIDDHFERARSLGLTDKELDEAAWCAIVVGGAPVFTFWKQARERAGGAGQGR